MDTNRYCLKHNEIFKHGLKKGFSLKKYKKIYHVSKNGYISYCDMCLKEFDNLLLGEKLFID